MKRLILVIFICIGFLVSCGYGLRTEGSLKIASSKDIINNRVKSGSYILSSPLDSAMEVCESYPFSDPSIISVRFLGKSNTSLDLADGSKSYGVDPTNEEEVCLYRVDFEDPSSAVSALEKLAAEGNVVYAEPNYISREMSDLTPSFSLVQGYNVVQNESDHWFGVLNLKEAIESFREEYFVEDEPIIAVLDSGVDVEHFALTDRVWENPGVDAGCEGDTHGCNTTNSYKGYLGNGNVFPAWTEEAGMRCPYGRGVNEKCGHGTMVAGLIAASLQSGERYGGICPFCKILPLRIIDDKSGGDIQDDAIIAGLNYIKNLKNEGVPVRVVNASFGKYQKSVHVNRLIRDISRSGKGTLFVAAAGNENSMEPSYPAALDDVMAVANIDTRTMAKHPSSNFGQWVDISSPGSGYRCGGGVGLISTLPGNGVSCAEGTSFSAPLVAGVAGLVLAANPDMSVKELRKRLMDTAKKDFYSKRGNRIYQDHHDGENLYYLGSGVVNAEGALKNISVESDFESPKKSSRVKTGCGSVGIPGDKARGGYLVFILLFVTPCLILLASRSRRIC